MATYELPIVNNSAEDGTNGWDEAGGVLTKGANPSPDIGAGDFYWYSESNFASLGQTVLVNPEVFTAIDNNSGFVAVQFVYGNMTTPRGSGVYVFIDALDVNGAFLTTAYESGVLIGANEDTWYDVNTLIVLNAVPPGTRRVRLRVIFGDGSSPSNAMIDAFRLFSSDGEFTTVRVAAIETNTMYSRSSDMILSGYEVLNDTGEGARVYEDGMRVHGLETQVMYSREGILDLIGYEVLNSTGDGRRNYEDGMRVHGLEANVMYSREGILNVNGLETLYMMGKASDLQVNGLEMLILSSVKQKYTPIVAIFNEATEEPYMQTNRFGICYEQPVRG